VVEIRRVEQVRFSEPGSYMNMKINDLLGIYMVRREQIYIEDRSNKYVEYVRIFKKYIDIKLIYIIFP
jgi:hypothetical protein